MKKSSLKRTSLKKNLALSMFYQILKIITPFITAPYVSRVLGVANLGIYSATNSIAMYFTLFGGLGTVTYGTREIARVRHDENQRSQLFWEIEILSVITTTISIVVWAIFTMFNTQYRGYYLVLTFNLLAVMFDISWFYAGIEKFQYTVGWNSFFKIASVIALFIFVKKPSDLLVYMFIMAFQNFAGNVGMWTGLHKFVHKIDFKTVTLKKHFHETLVYFIPTIATSVYNVMDKTMIWVITRNAKENGFYENANKVLDMTKTLTFVALNSVMTSRISFLYAQERFDEIKEGIHNSIDYVLFMGIGFLFGLAGVAHVFVPVFFGKHWDKTAELLIIMAPVVVIIGISNCLGAQYYTPSGRRKESAKYIIIGAITNFILNSFMIPFLQSYGAAIATVIAEVVITFFYVKNDAGYLTWKDIFTRGWKKLIAGSCMFGAIMLVRLLIHQQVISLLLTIIVGVMVYIGILFMLKDSFMDTGKILLKVAKNKKKAKG